MENEDSRKCLCPQAGERERETESPTEQRDEMNMYSLSFFSSLSLSLSLSLFFFFLIQGSKEKQLPKLMLPRGQPEWPDLNRAACYPAAVMTLTGSEKMHG